MPAPAWCAIFKIIVLIRRKSRNLLLHGFIALGACLALFKLTVIHQRIILSFAVWLCQIHSAALSG